MNRFFTLLLAASCLTAVGQVPDYVPTDGLVAWLPLDGNFDGWSAQDASWNVVGTSSGFDRFGSENGAAVFNGNGDWASSSQSLIPTEGDFTISIWLLGYDNGLHAEGIAQGGSSINSTYIGNTPEGNIRVGGGGNWAWDNLESFPFEVWTHFLVTKTESISTLYVDGEVFSTSTEFTNPVNSGATFIGRQQNPFYEEYWLGSIDDIGIWQRVLGPDEVAMLYNWSPIAGCIDELACNFNEDAVTDDNSCDLFTCKCLEGTIWSEELGGCIVANPSDSNFDGCVQLNDLLDLLSAYGDCGAEESPWQCGEPLEYQGYDYETVQIGEQCWFAENSRYFPEIFPFSFSPNCNDALAYVTGYDGYDENAASEFVQGGSNVLYNAFAVADWNLCPSGWHVSTDGDWVELEVAIGMSSTEANSTGYRGTDEAVKLASTNWFGTDEFGFTMMSSAWRDLDGGEYGENGVGAAQFWTSTPSDEGSSWYRYISAQSGVQGQILRFPSANNAHGYSVRCIKD